MERYALWIAALTALGSALSGGAFLAFSSFVMPALARLPDEQAAEAMNSINICVINWLFMTVLFAPGLGALALLGCYWADWLSSRARVFAAGTAIYLFGCIGVTIFGNVPLNDRLALIRNPMELAGYWPTYLAGWTRWNSLRAVACIATSSLIGWGAILDR